MAKRTGAAIEIFDSSIVLAKWMIGGPEITRMLENFKDSFNDEVKGNDETKNHENTASFEKLFQKEFEALKK